MAKNREKQAILRQEILSILPEKSSKLSPEKLRHLPYLRACMKEAHRVIPVLNGTIREMKDDIILQGYQIPRGIHVAMANGYLLRQEQNYAKAQEFIPERWLKKGPNNAHPFIYLPFGFGARMCIGKRFAELEIANIVIRMVRNFEMTWNYGDLRVRSSLVDTLVGDMKFQLKDV